MSSLPPDLLDAPIVHGYGRLPNPVLLVGEAPGREEAFKHRPFVGASGQAQEQYLSRHRLTARYWYMTNVVKTYIEDNPDPTPELVQYWTPTLLQEIADCNPSLIIAVGRFAARFFLGADIDMSDVHGIPHRPVLHLDTIPSHCCILPVFHPAGGLYNVDTRGVIAWDYAQVAATLKLIEADKPIPYRVDEFAGRESYIDMSGSELAAILSLESPEVLSIDTEGIPSNSWSIQVTIRPGQAYVLRCSCPDFAEGIAQIQRLVDHGCLIITHQASTPTRAMYDNAMCRAMRLELRDANLFDTMYWAFLLRTEPQGLKALAYRWCGMAMTDYMSVLGGIGRDKQIEYLEIVAQVSKKWPKPAPIVERQNNGTVKTTKPKSIAGLCKGILGDIAKLKRNKDGELTDPFKRWQKTRAVLRRPVEAILGPMPTATLDDVPLEQAVAYAGRDSDATFRIWQRAAAPLQRLGLTSTMSSGMPILRIVDEMSHYGMQASLDSFLSLYADCLREMNRLQPRISTLYANGRPFNPGSPVDVAWLLDDRGLKALKRTKTGRPSTDKKSIEYLRGIDTAISDVFDWREAQHVKDSFCVPVLELAGIDVSDLDDADGTPKPDSLVFSALDRTKLLNVHCSIKSTRIPTRRFAATGPNLLALPVRKDFGRRVRDGYVCPPGYLYGSWDLSQIEMRFIAHESSDPFLVSSLCNGLDIHCETASRIFRVPVEVIEETKANRKRYRDPAKNAGFGIIYGIGGDGLLTQLRMLGIEGWTADTCQTILIDGWLDICSGVRDYIEDVAIQTRRDGYIRDISGAIRYLPAIYDPKPSISNEAARHAVSHRIQGGAQTMIQNSMIWIDREIRDMQRGGLDVHWCLQVHDELIFQFKENLADLMHDLVLEGLINHSGVTLRVPIGAEGKVAKTWGELK